MPARALVEHFSQFDKADASICSVNILKVHWLEYLADTKDKRPVLVCTEAEEDRVTVSFISQSRSEKNQLHKELLFWLDEDSSATIEQLRASWAFFNRDGDKKLKSGGYPRKNARAWDVIKLYLYQDAVGGHSASCPQCGCVFSLH
ncbi:unnamed protein product [Amoebophrya sp. A25]|nr:unnamed protein product [Amoebophrya sp. A25]|eukprot:GSA25T00002931001.1